MDYIIYDKHITSEILKNMNIVISDKATIGNNVKISAGVCLIGCVEIGDHVEIRENTIIENSRIGNNVKIVSSYIENSVVGEYTEVGPFAHIHKGSAIAKHCRIGNFVEIKNSKIDDRTKIAHLTYVGDSVIGKNCNIGCGVVFCNYNGKIKQGCILKDNVFIGSNVNLVAPVVVEEGGYIAAGSTINCNVEKNEFAIARAKQVNKNNFKNPYLEKINSEKNL